MRRLAIFLFILSTPLVAQESWTLTTPETTPDTPTYRPERIVLEWKTGQDENDYRVFFQFRGPNDERITCEYIGADAQTDLATFNTANLSSGNSLHKRVMNKARALGCLPSGAVTGTPQ